MNMLRQLCSVSLGLCQSNVTHTVDVPSSDESYCCGYPFRKDISGGYCGGVPPLPIPNREVKPTYADGTAMQCGRVGSRLLLEKSEALRVAIFSGLLLFCYACSGHAQAPSSSLSISGHARFCPPRSLSLVMPRLCYPCSQSQVMQGSVIHAVSRIPHSYYPQVLSVDCLSLPDAWE